MAASPPGNGQQQRALTNPGATCRKGSAMNESDIEDRLDLNSGKEWSEMDLFDLANSIRLKNPIEEIAQFLCRSGREVREKTAELERSGGTRQTHRGNGRQRSAGLGDDQS
jgi:hypothetical protein